MINKIYDMEGIQTTLTENKEIEIKGNKYKNQINAINYIFDENIATTKEYHTYIQENIKLIENNMEYFENKFKKYLENYEKIYIKLENKKIIDTKEKIEFSGTFNIKAVNRFLKEYKIKQLGKINLFTKYIQKLKKEKIKKENKIIKIIKEGCIFITITSKENGLNSIIHYKNNWKKLYNNLRNTFIKYGIDYKKYIKGVELTKSNRLHLHILFLNINLNPYNLINFKKDVENFLKLNNFGIINDITYITNKYTYYIKNETEKRKIEKNKNIKIIGTIKTGNIKYEKKEIKFSIIKAKYKHKEKYKENYTSNTKIINYILKYILKEKSYNKIENKNKFIKYNTPFWITGIRKYEISRELTKIIKEVENKLYEKRYNFMENTIKKISEEYTETINNLYNLYQLLGIKTEEYMKKIHIDKWKHTNTI